MFKNLIACVAALIVSCTAFAGTQTVQKRFSSGENYIPTVYVGGFNPALGTLTSVKVSVEVEFGYRWQAEDFDCAYDDYPYTFLLGLASFDNGSTGPIEVDVTAPGISVEADMPAVETDPFNANTCSDTIDEYVETSGSGFDIDTSPVQADWAVNGTSTTVGIVVDMSDSIYGFYSNYWPINFDLTETITRTGQITVVYTYN